eukprot:g241.t1
MVDSTGLERDPKILMKRLIDDEFSKAVKEIDNESRNKGFALPQNAASTPKNDDEDVAHAAKFQHAVNFVQALGVLNNKQKEALRNHKIPDVSVNTPQQLKFYGYFKQATLGDNKKPAPSMFSPVARAKWGAWSGNKGLTKHRARILYLRELKKLQSNWENVADIIGLKPPNSKL